MKTLSSFSSATPNLKSPDHSIEFSPFFSPRQLLEGGQESPEKLDLENQIEIVAAQLRAHSFERTDRIALALENSIEYAVLIMAMLREDLVAVLVNNRFPPAQITKLVGRLNCKAIISNDFSLPNGAVNAPPIFQANRFFRPLHKASKASVPPPKIPLDQDATIIFTSGSSGTPKAVLHTFGNHYFSALGANQNIPFGPGDRWLASLPFYHVGGLSIIFRAMLGGGAAVIPEGKIDLAETVRQHEITHLSLVPTQLYRLLKSGKTFPSLKAVLLGGAPAPHELVQKALDSNLPIFTTYGSTEMASQITCSSPKDGLVALANTSGRLLPYRKMKIANDGEILVKGETLFKDYLNREGKPDTPTDRDGWFHTGDIGEIDTNGCLSILGRKDNMFISGGENIHPEEIENTLHLLDEIEQSVVAPISDAEFGKRPVAFVRWAEGKQMRPEEIRAFLASKLARYKIPIKFLPWPKGLATNGLKIARDSFAPVIEKIKT